MRRVVAVGIVMAILWLRLPVYLFAQSCPACVPHRFYYTNPYPGTYYVCVEVAGFTQDEVNATYDGIDEYWSGVLSSSNSGIVLAYRDNEPCHDGDIVVSRDASIQDGRARADLTPHLDNSGIRLPTSDQLGGNFTLAMWKWSIAHEFGHLLDYKDAYEGSGQLSGACQNNTVMGDSWTWSGLKCGDSQAVSTRFSTPEETPSEVPIGYDCYASYWVVRYWCYTPQGGWWECGGSSTYLGTWCY